MICSVLRNTILTLAMLAGMLSATSARGALLVIDDFDLPSPAQVVLVPVGGNPLVVQQTVASGVIGGERDIRIASTGSGNNSNYAIGVNAGQGLFDANTAVLRTDTMMLQYDGDDVDAAPNLTDNMGLLVDLTDSGANTELLIRFANSQVPVTSLLNVFITIKSLNGTSTYSGQKADNPTPGGIPQLVDWFVPFAAFTPGADFTDVRSLTFRFNDDGLGNGSQGVDLELDLIAAVPEPGTATLLAFGFIGLFAARRSRRGQLR